jgi:RHH-type proline utilization regulon transcriptional repressor/proline dehydrogenase/delta 1-pyrroline-5-carboxylate dehydrogenase
VPTQAASEADILAVGRDLAAALPGTSRNPLKAIDDKAMDLASQDADLRAALFRFVDVVPACRSLDDLARHLSGFLDEVGDRPPPLQVAMRMSESRAGRQALGAAAAAGVKHMAHRFIVGETPREATGVLEELWKKGVATSVDLLGEATVTSTEADRYAARCREALEGLVDVYRRLPARPALEADSAGRIPRENLSVKVSALTPLLRPDAPELGKRDAAVRLRDLLRRARELDAHLHIDMESFDSREAVTELVLELLSEDEFREGPSAGLVLQAYLRDSPELCERIVTWAQATPRGYPLLVRLVKGAYWDHEIVEARQHGWESPVFEDKADSDGDVEVQVLRGLGDDLQEALAKRGLRVRTYCPVGDLVAGMAYLVRRLLENTSNESFLHEQAAGRSLDELLAAP